MCQFLGLSVGPRTFAYSSPYGSAIGSGKNFKIKIMKKFVS